MGAIHVRMFLGGVAGCLIVAVGVAAEDPSVAPPAQATVPVFEFKYRTVHPQLNGPAFFWRYRGLPVSDSATEAAARTRIDAALERVIDEKMEFLEIPLGDVALMLQAFLEVPVMLDRRALEEAGFDPGTQVTGCGQGITARSFLRRVLRDSGLTMLIRDEALVITTQDAAQSTPEIRFYPLPFGAGRGPRTDFQSLIELLQNTVEPAAWESTGGAGAIRLSEAVGEPVLVVSQTLEIHEHVEAFLATLHARGLAEFGGEGQDAVPVTRIYHVGAEQLRDELAAKLTTVVNAALTAGQDADAVAEAVSESLVVRSSAPGFHIRAAQLIDALQGVQVPEGGGNGAGGMGMGGGF